MLLTYFNLLEVVGQLPPILPLRPRYMIAGGMLKQSHFAGMIKKPRRNQFIMRSSIEEPFSSAHFDRIVRITKRLIRYGNLDTFQHAYTYRSYVVVIFS